MASPKDQVKQQIGIFALIFPAMMVCLLIIGITLANIFHFWIEDYFDQPIIGSFFFGIEYAISLAWLIISSVCYLILSWFRNFLISNHRIPTESKSSKFFFNTFFVLFILISVFYLVSIIYEFLSGSSDAAGLFRILVTLVLNQMGLVYLALEHRQIKKPSPRMYLGILSTTILAFIVVAIWVSFKHASPNIMRSVRQDIQRVSEVEKISTAIKDYYKNNNALPKSLNDLAKVGLVQEHDLIDPLKNHYEYKVMSSNGFAICATFERSSKEARRVQLYSSKHYEKGKQCQNYQINKVKDGIYNLEVRVSNNVNLG